MYLLPKDHAATKKILDLYPSPGMTTCDIYQESAANSNERQQQEAQKQQIEEFIRFLETCVNKIKKTNCHKSSRVSIRECIFFYLKFLLFNNFAFEIKIYFLSPSL